MENLEECKGKNWMATMAWCWGLGGFGAHRFYTGKTGSAVAILIMTLTGCLAPISLIWVLVDGFTIALNKYKHADGSELYEYSKGVGIGYMIWAVVVVLMAICYMLFYLMVILAFIGSASGN